MALKVWLPLDGDLRNLGTSDAAITNNGATIDSNGKIGKCYSFNGNNYYIALTGQELFDCFKGGTAAFSICMWVYHADTRRAVLFGDYGLSNSIGFNIELSTGHNLRFYWNGSPDYSPGLNVGLNTWNHIALTYDGASLKSYLNGNLVATRSGALATRNKVAGEFRLGRDYRTTDTALNGKLNDIRVYGDHCLSAAEVHEIAQGLVLHYKLDGPMGGSGINLMLNTNAEKSTTYWGNWGPATNRSVVTLNGKKWFHFTASAGASTYGGFYQDNVTTSNQLVIKPNTNYTISALMYASDDTQCRFWYHIRSTEGGANITQGAKNITVTTTPQIYSYTFNSGTNSTYTINRLNMMIGSAYESTTDHEVYFTEVKLEEGSVSTPWTPAPSEIGIDTTIIEDSSGYRHNCTQINVTNTNDTARYNYSSAFDGSSFISKSTSDIDIQTLTCWAKTTKNKSTAQMMVADQKSNMCLCFYSNSIISYFGNSSGAGTGSRSTLGSEYKENQWNFFAAVKTDDAGGRDVYCNGVKLTPTTNDYYSATCAFGIGNRSNGGNIPFYGQISDVRAYCTPLLDTDIKQLYNVGMKVDNLGGVHSYTFNETNENILFNVEKARTNLTFTDGLSKYTQPNCQVTLTEQGYHIYRPPNLTTANDGSTMWGGLLINNQTTRTIAAYDASRDNIWNLQKNHTYIFAFHAKGQSSNSPSLIVESNMGWDRIAGVGPNPTYLASKTIPTNFDGEQDCYIIFKIEDDIVKVATESKSSYVQGTSYLSYKELCLNYGYTATGTLGTDLYLTNFRLYDITDQISQVKKTGVINFSSLVEQADKAQIRKNSELLATEFIEM